MFSMLFLPFFLSHFLLNSLQPFVPIAINVVSYNLFFLAVSVGHHNIRPCSQFSVHIYSINLLVHLIKSSLKSSFHLVLCHVSCVSFNCLLVQSFFCQMLLTFLISKYCHFMSDTACPKLNFLSFFPDKLPRTQNKIDP